MDLWKEFGSSSDDVDLSYNSGSDERFNYFLSKVKNNRVRNVVANVRILLKSNVPAFFRQAFKNLESLMEDFLDERLVIDRNDYEAFAFLGRQYEVIARYFQNAGLVVDEKEIYESSCERALALFALGSKEKRARSVFNDLVYFNKFKKYNNNIY
ncbi:hypothetical protein B6U93_02160 [Candidatus Woesearchaeota archaeon ex4484_78]|nr:MAG: hypothetical protein B6U93_02160 [Candidatus Woesearchaeota archaeon ex4484_78]